MGIAERPAYLRDVVLHSALGGITYDRLQNSDFVLMLLHEISEFRARAASYRDFRVSAGAWGTGEAGRYGRVLGYNVKLDESDTVNIHAEDIVLAKAKQAGLRSISVLAVVAPTQEDHASGKETATLHPCGRCRTTLSESPLITDDTLIVTARPDFTAIQLASLSAIRAAHENDDESGIATFHYPATPAIFAPRNFPDDWELYYGDVAPRSVQEIDSKDFDESVGLYLLQRAAERRTSGGF
jgi:cytidine deaminase